MTGTVEVSSLRRTRSLRRRRGSAPWARWQLLVLALVVLYGLLTRQGLRETELASGRAGNAWDHVVTVLASPYPWLFGLAPAWLVWSALNVTHEAEWSFLARAGSHTRWTLWSVLGAGRRALLVCAGVLAAAVATAFGLPWSLGWSELALSTDLSDADPTGFVAVLAWWATTGIGPVLAVVGQLLWVSVTLLGWHAVLGVVQVWLRRPSWTLAAAIAMWCWIVLAFRLEQVPAVLSPYYGLSLAGAVHAAGVVGAGVVLALPWLLAAAGAAALDWRARSKATPRAVSARVWLLLAAAVCVAASGFRGEPGDIGTSLVRVLYGAGPDGTTLMLYLLNVMLVLGPAYLFAADLESWRTCLPVMVLRHGSYLGWFARMLRPWLWRAPALMAGWALVAVLSAAARGAVWDAALWPLTSAALYQWLVNGSIQILVALVLVFAASWLSGSEHASLITLVVMAALGVPAVNLGRLLPFGLSGTGWALGGWPTMLSITLQLGCWLLLLVALCVTVLGRPRLKLNERNLA